MMAEMLTFTFGWIHAQMYHDCWYNSSFVAHQ